MKFFSIPALLLFITMQSSAQTANNNNIVVSGKVQDFAQQIFKNYPSYITPNTLSILQEHYNRIEIKNQPAVPGEKLTLLSSAYLINKYNPELHREDQSFDPTTFNPLKYGLNFDSKTDVVYRIDNTSYIILIHKRS